MTNGTHPYFGFLGGSGSGCAYIRQCRSGIFARMTRTVVFDLSHSSRYALTLRSRALFVVGMLPPALLVGFPISLSNVAAFLKCSQTISV
jgi:hypothetical protein